MEERREVLIEAGLLVAHPANPRGEITAESVADLVASIRANGQGQPCLVRPFGAIHQVILGHRRVKACEVLERPVLCIVQAMSDEQALSMLASEGETIQGQDPLLQADVVGGLLDAGHSLRQVADMLGRAPSWVARRANLRTLHPDVRARRASGRGNRSWWPIDWLELYAGLVPKLQVELLDQVDDRWSGASMTADRLRRIVAEHLHELKRSPWKLDDGELLPAAGACADCPKTSLRTPGLFDDLVEPAGDPKLATCRDGACWAEKLKAHGERALARAREKHPEAILIAGECGEGAGKGVISRYDVKSAKKNAEGAVPAIVAGGDGAGTVRYVIPKEHARARVEKATKAVSPPSEAERLADSKAQIAARRQAHVVDAVREAIADGKLPAPGVEVVMKLVAGFAVGAPRKPNQYSPEYEYDIGDQPEAVMRIERAELNGDAWAVEIWLRLTKSILGAIQRRDPRQLMEQIDLALWVADLIGLDCVAMQQAAAAAVPDPKWWAKAEASVPAKRERKAKAAPAAPSPAPEPAATSAAYLDGLHGEPAATGAAFVRGSEQPKPRRRRKAAAEFPEGWEPTPTRTAGRRGRKE